MALAPRITIDLVYQEVEKMKKKMSDLHDEHTLRIKAEEEIKRLKSMGFFKRLFS